MSHEEEVVRNAYAKVAFQCGIRPVTDAAAKQAIHIAVDQTTIDNNIARATPVFDLSGFQTGPIESIANQKWAQFVSLPEPGSQILMSTSNTQNFQSVDTDSPNQMTSASWQDSDLRWVPPPELDTKTLALMSTITVAEAISLSREQWADPKATYTRYAAFSVNVTFQGRSSGLHKVLFLFGSDQGKEIVAQNDLISGPQSLWDALYRPFYPRGLLLTK